MWKVGRALFASLIPTWLLNRKQWNMGKSEQNKLSHGVLCPPAVSPTSSVSDSVKMDTPDVCASRHEGDWMMFHFLGSLTLSLARLLHLRLDEMGGEKEGEKGRAYSTSYTYFFELINQCLVKAGYPHCLHQPNHSSPSAWQSSHLWRHVWSCFSPWGEQSGHLVFVFLYLSMESKARSTHRLIADHCRDMEVYNCT